MKHGTVLLLSLVCIALAASVLATPMETIPNPQEGGRVKALGTSIAIDGDWMVVGAPKSEYGGLAEVYHRDSGSGKWVRVGDLLPDFDRDIEYAFGRSVAISSRTVVVGAAQPLDPVSPESVHVYVRDANDVWTKQAVLTPSVGDTTYGVSVAISGDLLAVGASPEGQLGRVHIYERDGSGSWAETAVIAGPTGLAGMRYGWSVALEGDRLVVGAPDASDGTKYLMGMMYIYEREGVGQWSEPVALSAPKRVNYGYFGNTVDISGDSVVAVGLRQSHAEKPFILKPTAYVFDRLTPTSWTLQGVLQPPDQPSVYGDEVPLATSLAAAIDGDRTVVLASQGYLQSRDSSLQIYERDGTGTWSELDAPVYDSTPLEQGILMPIGLALSSDTAVCPVCSNARYSESSLIVLEDSGVGGWRESDRISWRNRAYEGHFGTAMASTGETLFVGAPDDEGATSITGAVYIYDMSDPTSPGIAVALEPPAPDAVGRWGWSLAACSGTLAVPSTFGGPNILIYNEETPGEWTCGQTLTLPALGENATLGDAMAMDSQTLVAYSASIDGAAVYRRDGGVWALEQVIPVPAFANTTYGSFGYALALLGDVLFVGTPFERDGNGSADMGVVYVYRRDGSGTWNYGCRLVSPFWDMGPPPPAGMMFGWSLAAQPGMLFVGEVCSDAAVENGGAVHIFAPADELGTSWSLQQTLFPEEPIGMSSFGAGLAVSGSSAIVLAPCAQLNGGDGLYGYLFSQEQDGDWQEALAFRLESGAYEYGPNAESAMQINALFVGPETFVVGGEEDNTRANNAGAVYLYDVSTIFRCAMSVEQQATIDCDDQFYAMAVNFATGEMADLFGGYDPTAFWFTSRVGEWVGLYLYDFPTGQWVEGMFVLRNRVE